jgi:hypothetical protein
MASIRAFYGILMSGHGFGLVTDGLLSPNLLVFDASIYDLKSGWDMYAYKYEREEGCPLDNELQTYSPGTCC